MRAIHGGKAKNDKIDSHKIAVRMRGGPELDANCMVCKMIKPLSL